MRYDVAILGAGIGGTLLATVLARHGLRVVVLEAGVHPRFAIGESLIPETSLRFKLLAARYDVPEISWLGTFYDLRDHVSPACGVKRSFAFAWHEPGVPHRGAHSTQLPTLTPPVGPDAHLFRQDTDAWLMALALQHGAEVRQASRITDLDLAVGSARLLTADGSRVEARIVIDGTGHRSPVAAKLGLRESPTRLQTNSRSLFTHMIKVLPYDQVGPSRADSGLPVPWSQSTLHHCFDGGWLWIIPFDNHADATNPLCSVGLILDRRQHPDSHADPEAEFRSLVARFPSIAAQLARARAVRPWVSTGRLQYSSSRAIGPGFVLLPHAAGFVDPLYSSGLSITVAAIDLLAQRLIDAHRRRDWAVESFAEVDTLIQGSLDHYDRIVSRSFDAFRSFELFNAWNRVWALGNYLATYSTLSLHMQHQATGDRGCLDALHTPEHQGVLSSQVPEFTKLCDAGAEDVAAVVEGTLSPTVAAERILERIDQLPFIPRYMRFGHPEGRVPARFTLPAGARHILWHRLFAAPRWRRRHHLGLFRYASGALRFNARLLRAALRRAAHVTRDTLWAYNRDWRRAPQTPRGDGGGPACAPSPGGLDRHRDVAAQPERSS
ncbi:MAG TPA: hypothetical protein ENK18_24480 [Deltaproteobacteria bacterium]|nr:hypothetical protein [Deltaproteobacteria bacterium]